MNRTKQIFKKKSLMVVLGIITLYSFMMIPLSAQSELVIGTAFAPPLSNPEGTGMLDQLNKEAFKRMGITVVIKPVPGERSLVDANSGKIDGDIIRVEGVDAKYTNLVRIPEEVMVFEFVVFSKSIKAKISGWSSLKPYTVAFINGWQILHNNVKGTKGLHLVNDADSLFQVLQKGRVDLAIYERLEGYGVIKKFGFNQIHALEPPLASKPMFLYINKKHKNLVEKITATYRNMKKDGTWDKIVDAALLGYGVD